MLCCAKIVLLFLLLYVQHLEAFENLRSIIKHRYRDSDYLKASLVHVQSVGRHDIHFFPIEADNPSFWEWESYDLGDTFRVSRNGSLETTTFRSNSTSERKPVFRIYHNTTFRSLTHVADGNAYLSVENSMDHESKFTLAVSDNGFVDAKLQVVDFVLSLSDQAQCRLTGTAENVVIADSEKSSTFVNAFDLDIDRLILSSSNRTRLILGNVNKFINSPHHKSSSVFQFEPKDPKPMLIYDGDNNYRILH